MKIYTPVAYLKKIKNKLKESRSRNPLIIYTMGKVGSQTIERSLQALKLNESIYHIHHLTERSMDGLQRLIEEEKDVTRYSKKLAYTRHLRKQIYANNNKRWEVVSLVREPIARSVSSFFHLMRKHKPDLDFREHLSRVRIKELQELFVQKQDTYHKKASTWFDSELKEVFGFDIFSSNFPKQKGYKIYKGERADLLLIKLEHLNKCCCDAFKEFLNIQEFDLINTNISRDKVYATAYQDFIGSINLSDTFLEKMYSLRYVRHFYSKEEIDGFRDKWSR